MAGKKGRSGNKVTQERLAVEQELFRENKAIASMGSRWKERRNVYIALEQLEINYTWDEKEVLEVTKLIEEGMDMEGLAVRFDRPANDLRVLILELALLREITQLPYGF